MKIKRVSVLSGVERIKDIPVDPQDWINYKTGFYTMDEAFPYLSDDDRDFIVSGITPEEWKRAFEEIGE